MDKVHRFNFQRNKAPIGCLMIAVFLGISQGCSKPTCSSGKQKLGGKCCDTIAEFYPDRDGDGYGDASSDSIPDCGSAVISDYVTRTGDCEDSDASIHPEANDVCDESDNDCDSKIDEDIDTNTDALHCGSCGNACTFENATASCAEGECKFDACEEGFVNLDANQANGCEYACTVSIRGEVCDGVDNNCDGVVDEGCEELCESGQTRDCGIDRGVCAIAIQNCVNNQWAACPGLVDQSEEVCDGDDNDCDGEIDEDLNAPIASLVDGVCEGTSQVCNGRAGWREPDYNQIVGYERMESSCDNLDNNCNGQVDEEFNFDIDSEHCGGCNIRCENIRPEANACVDGECRVPCQEGSVCGENELCDPTDGYCISVEQFYLEAQNVGASDEFGHSISADQDRIVIGAPFEDGNLLSSVESYNDRSLNVGAVYVFERQEDGSWLQTAYLKAGDTRIGDNLAGLGDQFGHAVALEGDRIVVGAPREDGDVGSTTGMTNNRAQHAGAVYVFELQEDGSWLQTAYLKAQNAERNDYFGSTVATNNGRIVVGALGEDGNAVSLEGNYNNSASSAGAVYIFELVNDRWRQTAYLKSENVSADDYFGQSISIDRNRIAIGTHREDGDAESTMQASNDNLSNAGAVYVFELINGIWRQTAYLKPHNVSREDWFGVSVALEGERIVVGAHAEDGDAGSTVQMTNDDKPNAGAVYVFELINGNWRQTAYLKPHDNSISDYFGLSVALEGDRIAVGSRNEDGGADSTMQITNDALTDSGAVYLFELVGRQWQQTAYLKQQNPRENSWFGTVVSLRGNHVFAGANKYDADNPDMQDGANETLEDAGAVHVFSF